MLLSSYRNTSGSLGEKEMLVRVLLKFHDCTDNDDLYNNVTNKVNLHL